MKRGNSFFQKRRATFSFLQKKKQIGEESKTPEFILPEIKKTTPLDFDIDAIMIRVQLANTGCLIKHYMNNRIFVEEREDTTTLF